MAVSTSFDSVLKFYMAPLSCFSREKVTAEEDGSAHFDAFQVSKQCMEMVAEGALEVGESLALLFHS